MASNRIRATAQEKKSSVVVPKRPRFSALWASYPEGAMEDVYKLVGGDVYAHYLQHKDDVNSGYNNSCALRISRSFNSSGFEVPKGTQPEGKMYRLKGEDGKAYFMRKEDVAKFIRSRWGKPEITVTTADKAVAGEHNVQDFETQIWSVKIGLLENSKQKILQKRGLLIFDVRGWRDASGHVTLWDGEKCVDDTNYFDANLSSVYAYTEKYELWELK